MERVALYNPMSQRRRRQLAAARDILLAHRPTDTPVIVARNLARDGETVRVLPLAELAADTIDMLSLVIVGNRTSRAVRRGADTWVYAPRGYAPECNAETGT